MPMSLWDDVRRGAQTVVDESQRLTRLARLAAELKGLESELADLLYELGTRTLELHRKNELYHVELDELFVDIEGLQRSVHEKEAEVAALKDRGSAGRAEAEGHCAECGAESKPGDRFCRHCGSSLRA